MKRETTRLMIFAAALALALPGAMMTSQSEAQAFGAISKSRSGGKRTHKAASKKSDTKKSSSSGSSTTTRTTTTRSPSSRTHYTNGQSRTTTTTRTTRPASSSRAGTTRTTTSTRTRTNTRPNYGPQPTTSRRTVVVNGQRRTTTTTTTTRTNSRRYYRDSGPAYYNGRSRTTVNNNYYYGNTQPAPPARAYQDDRGYEREDDSSAQAYITGSVGISGMAAPKISDEALPGMDFNLGLGGRSEWVAMELGFGMGGYRLDPDASASDLLLLGTSLDLKLQPSILGVIEPYVMAGVGGQYFRDYVVNTSAIGGSLRLGAGLDLRFDDIALTVRYTFSQHGWLEDDRGVYPDQSLSAQTESLSAGLTLYF